MSHVVRQGVLSIVTRVVPIVTHVYYKQKRRDSMDPDFDDMTMSQQQQYILEYVLSEIGVTSIEVDDTAFENPKKESDG